MRLTDSHVHLHAYDDVAGLLERARAAGVVRIVGVPLDLATSEQTIDLARAHPEVVAAVGIHPARLDETFGPAALDRLARLAEDPRVGLIGEIGLDTVEAALPVERQLGAFEDVLRLARRLGRPVILHLYGSTAYDQALETLRRIGLPWPGAIVHYFAGDPALATRLLDQGLMISVGKPVTRPDRVCLRAAIRQVPLDRLLVETDAYPLPGRKTEPADVRLVVEAIAQLIGQPPERVAERTTENLERLLDAGRSG